MFLHPFSCPSCTRRPRRLRSLHVSTGAAPPTPLSPWADLAAPPDLAHALAPRSLRRQPDLLHLHVRQLLHGPARDEGSDASPARRVVSRRRGGGGGDGAVGGSSGPAARPALSATRRHDVRLLDRCLEGVRLLPCAGDDGLGQAGEAGDVQAVACGAGPLAILVQEGDIRRAVRAVRGQAGL